MTGWQRARRVGAAAVLGAGLALTMTASPPPDGYSSLPGQPASSIVAVRTGRTPPISLTFTALPRVPLASTPPMGWDGYNRFGRLVTARLAEAEARALVSSGMRAAGYTYLVLDGGWNLPTRGPQGQLLANPRLFPQGIAPVAAYVHSLGLKFGIYASAGLHNCADSSAGSYGHYAQDAATFASWGVDFVKLDWCYVPYQSYAHLSRAQVSRGLAEQFAAALVATHRHILLELNDSQALLQRDWTWAPPLATTWRTTGDISNSYRSILAHFTQSVGLYRYARPGHWNSPDFLEVGNPGLSSVDAQTQMSLWAEMAAPLVAGNDLTTMSAETRFILTRLPVIQVDQDPLGRAGRPVASSGGHWVLTRPLQGGGRSVVLFNQDSSSATISTTTRAVGLGPAPAYSLVNLWTGAVSRTSGPLSFRVGPHAAVMLRITPLTPASPSPATTPSATTPSPAPSPSSTPSPAPA